LFCISHRAYYSHIQIWRKWVPSLLEKIFENTFEWTT
jgi:hypothetical protein